MLRNASSVIAVAFLSTGCVAEQVSAYDLFIVNGLKTSIFYCEEYERTACPNQIMAGRRERIAYLSHSAWSRDSERFEAFDRKFIKLCGKTVGFATVRKYAQVMRGGPDRYEILIDSEVEKVFCR